MAILKRIRVGYQGLTEHNQSASQIQNVVNSLRQGKINSVGDVSLDAGTSVLQAPEIHPLCHVSITPVDTFAQVYVSNRRNGYCDVTVNTTGTYSIAIVG